MIETWTLTHVTYTKTRLYSQSDVLSGRVYYGLYGRTDDTNIRLIKCINFESIRLYFIQLYNVLVLIKNILWQGRIREVIFFGVGGGGGVS